MLDIKFVKENKAKVLKAIKEKQMNLDLDKLLSLYEEKKRLQNEIEALNAKRKLIAKSHDKIQEGKQIKQTLADLQPQLNEVSEELLELSLYLPNIPSDDSPIGDASSNKVTKKVGEPKKFDFKIKDHIQLGKDLDIIDLERGVKVSGFRGYYLKNEGAILHMAVLMYAFDKMRQKNFTPMIVPTLVHKNALIGSGHFPFGKEEIYQIANPASLKEEKIKQEQYLVGTAEPSLLAYRSDEIIDEKELPIKIYGISSCYRSEVGSYGKDTKGLFRLHEFSKVEQVIICKADHDEAEKMFNELRENSEEILRDLGLAYQIVQIATGDMGAGKYKMNDIETWMPSRKAYAETHSNSNLTDWQTRRLNIRYKQADGKKVYPFALNNTALASPRILIALLENYQQADGSIEIPKVLQKYTGFTSIKSKNK